MLHAKEDNSIPMTTPMTTPMTAPMTAPSYVKLIRKDRTHNGLCFQEGLNCLKETETFDKRPDCGPGGLYFCKEEDIGHWIHLYKEDLGYMATVTLCPDSNCVTMDKEHKLKSDVFFSRYNFFLLLTKHVL